MSLTGNPGTQSRTALEVRALSKHYGKVRALEDCDFTLPAGGVIALVGANGAGKSTLMGIVSGLVKPTSGAFRVGAGAGSRVVLPVP